MSEGRLADRAYALIIEIIEQDELIAGDRLPAETTLSDRFGISRTIIREALVRLTADGITEARRGAGSFVKRRPSERLARHMPIAMLPATLATYEVRFVLETEAARLAAQRCSLEQLRVIEDALGNLCAKLRSNDPAHDEDWALHKAIADASANPAFSHALSSLHDDIDRILRAGVDISRTRSTEAIEAMISEHEMIVESIRTQDADGAALAMRWHLSQGRKRLMPDGA